MKKIALLVLPFLLLTGCNKSSRVEISASEWQKEAEQRIAKVNQDVEAKNYPFTKYTMVGKEGHGRSEKDVNGEYTFTEGDWYINWNFEYKGEDTIPTRVIHYELFNSSEYYNNTIKNYLNVSGNSFKFYKEGNNLIIEAKYTSRSADKMNETLSFNEIGYATSVESYVGDQRDYSLKFTYSK